MNPDLAPVPASGRRRAAATSNADRRRWSIPQLAAVAVAVIGGLLVLAGGLRASVFAPSAITEASLASPDQPVITSAVGLLGLNGPRVEVSAVEGGRRPVFVGIGRAADVDSYLAQVSRLEVTGQDGDGKLLTARIGNQPTLPDPAGADVWVVSVRGAGTANLTWPDAPGQWRMVVATDGSAPAPDDVTLTWSGRKVRSAAPALIAIGLLLAVAGLITSVMLTSRARLDGDA
jgi:hypothetical protein